MQDRASGTKRESLDVNHRNHVLGNGSAPWRSFHTRSKAVPAQSALALFDRNQTYAALAEFMLDSSFRV
jgi:hypothetical protein